MTIVKDVLDGVFGFDKFAELTSEFQIRGTYCDIAVRIDNSVRRLIEVKAIGVTLKESHLRQATSYGASEGIEWIILTNGIVWEVYYLVFKKPVDTEHVFTLNLLECDIRSTETMERLYLLSREAVVKQRLREFKKRKDAVNRYVIAALLLHNDTVRNVLRRELNRTTGVRVDENELKSLLSEEVVKRDTVEGDKAADAARLVNRSEDKALRSRKTRKPKEQAASDESKAAVAPA